jgi:hypothetical protein
MSAAHPWIEEPHFLCHAERDGMTVNQLRNEVRRAKLLG